MKKISCLLFAAILLAVSGCNPSQEINEPSQDPSSDVSDNSKDPGVSEDPTQDPSGNPSISEDPSGGPVPDWYQTNYWDRTDREQLGIQGPVKSFKRANVKPYWEFEFDQAGHLVYERNYNTWDENPDPSTARYTWAHTYNDKGQRIKSVYYSGEYVSAEITYEYNNGDKIVPFDTFFAAQPDMTESGWDSAIIEGYRFAKGLSSSHEKRGTTNEYYTYVFDDAGNLTISYESKEDNNPDYDYTYSYKWKYQGNYPHIYEDRSEEAKFYKYIELSWRANGMPATGIFKDNVDTKYYEDVVYDCEWLDNPRMLTVKTQQQRGDNAQNDYFHVYSQIRTYNDHYMPETEVFEMYQRGTFFHYTWHDYVYDNYGNWTRRQEDGEPVGFGDPWTGSYQDRAFTYFSE